MALDKYNEALAIDNTYAPAYREIAELYFLAGKSSKSIESWKKYLELNNSNFARYRFLSALFKNKQYSEAISEYENLKKTNFNIYTGINLKTHISQAESFEIRTGIRF